MKKAKFFEKDGRLYFGIGDRDEVIPEKIVKQGRKRVERYVCKKTEEREKFLQKHREFCKNPNFVIGAELDGARLVGRIICIKDECIVVRLEKPSKYRGEDRVHFGWAAAMAHQYIFEGCATFSFHAIEAARNLLIKIYKKGLQKKSY